MNDLLVALIAPARQVLAKRNTLESAHVPDVHAGIPVNRGVGEAEGHDGAETGELKGFLEEAVAGIRGAHVDPFLEPEGQQVSISGWLGPGGLGDALLERA